MTPSVGGGGRRSNKARGAETCHHLSRATGGTSGAAGAPWGAFLGPGASALAAASLAARFPSLGPAVPVSPASCLGQSDLQVTHLDGGPALSGGSHQPEEEVWGLGGAHLGTQVPKWGSLERDGTLPSCAASRRHVGSKRESGIRAGGWEVSPAVRGGKSLPVPVKGIWSK